MQSDAPPKHELELRAEAGTLTFQDRQWLARARALRAGFAAEKTLADITREVGDISRTSLGRFAKSEAYHAALRVIDAPAHANEAADEESAIENARATLAGTLPEAMDFIAHCYRRDETKPDRPYVDEGLAQWATQTLLKSTGLGDPANQVNKPPVVITEEAMKVMLGAIRGDDQKRLPLPSITVAATVVSESGQ